METKGPTALRDPRDIRIAAIALKALVKDFAGRGLTDDAEGYTRKLIHTLAERGPDSATHQLAIDLGKLGIPQERTEREWEKAVAEAREQEEGQ